MEDEITEKENKMNTMKKLLALLLAGVMLLGATACAGEAMETRTKPIKRDSGNCLTKMTRRITAILITITVLQL